jgi:hypothetical protein
VESILFLCALPFQPLSGGMKLQPAASRITAALERLADSKTSRASQTILIKNFRSVAIATGLATPATCELTRRNSRSKS